MKLRRINPHQWIFMHRKKINWILTFAASTSLFNRCSVSIVDTCCVEPVNVAHCAGSTVQNSHKFVRSDSRAPSNKAQISLWINRAWASLELDPPPHFAELLTCGPKKIASIGPGDVAPRQFNFPLPIHGLLLFGALKIKWIVGYKLFNCDKLSIHVVGIKWHKIQFINLSHSHSLLHISLMCIFYCLYLMLFHSEID